MAATLPRFVDRLAPQADWRRVHRRANAAFPSVRLRVRQALVAPKDEINWSAMLLDWHTLQAEIMRGIMSSLNVDATADALAYKVTPLLEKVYGQVFESTLASFNIPEQPSISSEAFRAVNLRAVEWAERNAAKLIVGVTEETRNAIQKLVVRSLEGGIAPEKLIREIRDVLGLSSSQITTVTNERRAMEAANIAPERITSRISRLINEKLGERAEMIARTEVITAANKGQVDAWKEAVREGYLSERLVVKEWIVTEDEKLCDECEALDGVKVDINEEFPGGVMEPSLHPNCRCAVGLALREEE